MIKAKSKDKIYMVCRCYERLQPNTKEFTYLVYTVVKINTKSSCLGVVEGINGKVHKSRWTHLWTTIQGQGCDNCCCLLWIDEAKANINLYMNVGVMKDYKLRDLRASLTLGWLWLLVNPKGASQNFTYIFLYVRFLKIEMEIRTQIWIVLFVIFLFGLCIVTCRYLLHGP
jgi:hypothetical protein